MESSIRFETWKTGFDKLIQPSATTTGDNDAPDQPATADSSQKATAIVIKSEPEASEGEDSKPAVLPKSEVDENNSANEVNEAENGSVTSEEETGNPAHAESEGEGNGSASGDDDSRSGSDECDSNKSQSDCESATGQILDNEDPQQFDYSVMKWIKQQAERARTRILNWPTVSERSVKNRLEKAKSEIWRNLQKHKFTDGMDTSKGYTFEKWWANVFVKDVQDERNRRYHKSKVLGEFFKSCAKNNKTCADPMPDVLTLMNDQDYMWTRYYNWIKTQNAEANDKLSTYVEDYKEKMLGLLKKNVCSFDDPTLEAWHEQVLQQLTRPDFEQYSSFLDLDLMTKQIDEAVELARASIIAENTKNVQEELKCVRTAVDHAVECYMKKLKSRIGLNPMLDLTLEVSHLETESLLADAFGKVPDFHYTEVWNLDKCELAQRLIQSFEDVKKYNQEAMMNSQEKLSELKQKRSAQVGRSSCTPEPSAKRPRVNAAVQPGPSTSTSNNPGGCQGTQCPRWNTFINFKNPPCDRCKSQKLSNGAVCLMIRSIPMNPSKFAIYHQVEWGKSSVIEPTITIPASEVQNSSQLSFRFGELLDKPKTESSLVIRGQLQSLKSEEVLGASLMPLRQQIETKFGSEACKNNVAVMVPTSLSFPCSYRQSLKTGLKLAGFDKPILVQHMTAIGLWYSAAHIQNSGDQSLIVTLHLSESYRIEVSLVLVSHIQTEPICCQVISTIAERTSGDFSFRTDVEAGLALISQLQKDASYLPVPKAYVLQSSRDNTPSYDRMFQKVLKMTLSPLNVKLHVISKDAILSGLLLASKGAKYREVFPSAISAKIGSHDIVLTARNSPVNESVEMFILERATKNNTIEVSCRYASETRKMKYLTLPNNYKGKVQVVMKSDGCIEVSYLKSKTWVKVSDVLDVDDEEKLKKYRERVQELYSLPSTKVEYTSL